MLSLLITLYPPDAPPASIAAGHARQQTLAGAGTVESRWGTTGYSFRGHLRYGLDGDRFECLELSLIGRRVSGFACGDVRLETRRAVSGSLIDGGIDLECPAAYSDSNNRELETRLRMRASLQRGLDEIKLSGSARDFHYAEFLATGESLGGSE